MLKEEVCKIIDDLEERLFAISKEIHANPEIGFEEFHASRLLAKELEKEEFKVQLGIAGMNTAIQAIHKEKTIGPKVALLGEYDALPEIGHGCGHNLIATASLGATIALGKIKRQLDGELVFMGTPAEEGGGGKIHMIKAGLFEGVDAAMMFHPSSIYTLVGRKGLALAQIKIEFLGQAAHAAADPENGINALDAVIQTFNGINALREHITSDARIHGIITHGGVKPNIVPDYAAAEFYVRALKNDYCQELVEKLKRCAQGAALGTGAKLDFQIVEPSYESRTMNKTLGKAFIENLHRLGEPLRPLPPGSGLGSSDIGNVSQIVPTIHPYIAISDKIIPGHSKQFAEAAISTKGQKAMITAAKTLAMTAIDIYTKPALIKEMKEEFAKTHNS